MMAANRTAFMPRTRRCLTPVKRSDSHTSVTPSVPQACPWQKDEPETILFFDPAAKLCYTPPWGCRTSPNIRFLNVEDGSRQHPDLSRQNLYLTLAEQIWVPEQLTIEAGE